MKFSKTFDAMNERLAAVLRFILFSKDKKEESWLPRMKGIVPIDWPIK